MAFLTPELLREKPVADIQRAMFKDLVAMQKKMGTRDAFFAAVQSLPLGGSKKVSLLIVAPTRDAVNDWVERFDAWQPKPKLVADGTCVFEKGTDKGIDVELKKITGASRSFVVTAVTKALEKDPRFTVKDAQARPRPGEQSDESEDEERR